MSKCEFHDEFSIGLNRQLEKIDKNLSRIHERLDNNNVRWLDRAMSCAGALGVIILGWMKFGGK